MKEYNITIPNYTDFEKKIQNERDFFKYMDLLKEALPHYVLFIAVRDTPTGPVFTPAHSDYMMKSLGLRLNMQPAFRMPYAAVIDHGKVVFESSSKAITEPIIVNGNLNNHPIMVYSGGYSSDGDLGINAVFSVDGLAYYGYRGFNFYLYNVEKDYLADMSVYETYENPDKTNPLAKPFMFMNKIISNLASARGGGGILHLRHTVFSIVA